MSLSLSLSFWCKRLRCTPVTLDLFPCPTPSPFNPHLIKLVAQFNLSTKESVWLDIHSKYGSYEIQTRQGSESNGETSLPSCYQRQNAGPFLRVGNPQGHRAGLQTGRPRSPARPGALGGGVLAMCTRRSSPGAWGRPVLSTGQPPCFTHASCSPA